MTRRPGTYAGVRGAGPGLATIRRKLPPGPWVRGKPASSVVSDSSPQEKAPRHAVRRPLGVGVLHALLLPLVREPYRRRLNAVMVAGAGVAYLSGGGLGGREFAFTALITCVAFRGLGSWTFIGVGWLLHTAWDVVHHLKGNPSIPFAPPRRWAARSAIR